jgi:hypothetical protein
MATSASGVDFSMVLRIAYGLALWVGVLVGMPTTGGVEVIQEGHCHINRRRQMRLKRLNEAVTGPLVDE